MKFVHLLIFLLFSTAASGRNVGYEVEVIIFEDTSGLYTKSEHWPEAAIESSTQPEDANKISTASQSSAKATSENSAKKDDNNIFEPLNKQNYRLSKQALKLAKHPNYNLLFHKAWKQPGLDKKHALPMSINTLLESTLENPKDTNKYKSYIDGDITLIMSRYLHINAQFVLHKPDNIYADYENNAVDTYKNYSLVFERRMRSREIHYIDHPLVGIIVLAVPYEIKVEEEEESTPADSYKTL